MDSTQLISYKSDFKDQVFPSLAPWKYFNRYTNSSFIYKTLYFLGIYRNYLYILVKGKNQVLGSIVFRRKISLKDFLFKWFIYGVAIKEEQRGKGYGNILLEKSIEYLKLREISNVYLKVDSENLSAINLYKKFGFYQVSREGQSQGDLFFSKSFDN